MNYFVPITGRVCDIILSEVTIDLGDMNILFNLNYKQ